MGRRLAYLIGISEYGKGIESLPGCLHDVESMHECLSKYGAFEVCSKVNLNCYEMASTIEYFLQSGQKDDLLLIYFTGHGDVGGKLSQPELHFCSKGTFKQNGILNETSAYCARTLKRQLDRSIASQKVVILDCCHSGEFEKLMRKGNSNLFKALEAPGTVILASCQGTEESLQSSQGLSLYTKYLIEGMSNGLKGRRRNPGPISAGEIHFYIEGKMRSCKRKFTSPVIVSDRAGYLIPICEAPQKEQVVKRKKSLDRLWQETITYFNDLVDDFLRFIAAALLIALILFILYQCSSNKDVYTVKCFPETNKITQIYKESNSLNPVGGVTCGKDVQSNGVSIMSNGKEWQPVTYGRTQGFILKELLIRKQSTPVVQPSDKN
jgi:hypothetical protein